MSVLDRINQPNDIKYLSETQLEELPGEIRQFLIEHLSKTGGHLASNLGAVELTMALHLVLNFPEDKLIWDVGHQSYTHKILTGRKNEFDHLRQLDGMSGFPKRSESDCDCFDTGHSSTSISAGLGFARARDLLGEDYNVVSVIGDGALTGGMAFEALNNAAELNTNLIIVLNDNKMSISENVGGLSQHLASLRTAEAYQEFKSGVHSSLERLPYGERVVRRIRKTKSSLKQLLIPGMIFENMGVTYLGPVDGHNLNDMVRILQEAKKVNGPVVVHVQTEKGLGYLPAEEHPAHFHGTGPFDIATGKALAKKEKATYTDVFSTVICKIAAKNDEVVAITAAMADGTGLKRFRSEYPARFFDVGIAEGHAVTFAAGLAAAGLHPVFAVYSSFLQRGFDQVVHDVCMQNLPVVFAIDRAGLVGSDGETHQGIFDLSYLSMIPNMTVLSPKNKWELADMVRFAVRLGAPAAVRYPRGSAFDGFREYRAPIEYGKSEPVYEEEDIAIISVGHMFEQAVQVRKRLKEIGYNCTLINARFVKPVDEEMLRKLTVEHRLIVTLEENIRRGGFGEFVTAYLAGLETDAEVLNLALPDDYIEHGSVDLLRSEVMLDIESCVARIITAYIAEESRRD